MKEHFENFAIVKSYSSLAIGLFYLQTKKDNRKCEKVGPFVRKIQTS